MTFDELMVGVRIDERNQGAVTIEVDAGGSNADGGQMRRAIAARMMRVGAWLDGEAAERFVMARRTR
jgi:hypothetical protein